jgi:hypothetical protein
MSDLQLKGQQIIQILLAHFIGMDIAKVALLLVQHFIRLLLLPFRRILLINISLEIIVLDLFEC